MVDLRGSGSDAAEEPRDELLREIILDHYLNPEGREPLHRTDAEWHGRNPLCGDEVTVRLQLGGGRVEGIQVVGHGCTISMASASILASLVRGRSVTEARRVLGALRSILRGEEPPKGLEIGDLWALRGLRELPVRIKCALLPWTTFEEALEHGGVAGSLEVGGGQDG